MWSRDSGVVTRSFPHNQAWGHKGVDGQFPDQSPAQGQDPCWSNHLNSPVNPLPINSRMPMQSNPYGLRHDPRMDLQNNFRVSVCFTMLNSQQPKPASLSIVIPTVSHCPQLLCKSITLNFRTYPSFVKRANLCSWPSMKSVTITFFVSHTSNG